MGGQGKFPSNALSQPAPGARLLVGATAVLALMLLTVGVTVSPATGPVVATMAVVLAAGWTVRRTIAGPLAVAAGTLTIVLLMAVVAAEPSAGPVSAAGAVLLAALWHVRRAIARPLAIAAVALSAGTLALLTAVWPATMAVGAIVSGIAVLAWRAPGWALAAGILLFGFEGSVKILLGLEPTPLPVSSRAAGAGALDVALFAAVAGALAADRLSTPRAIWATASRPERGAIVLLGAWLVLSFLQIAQSGDVGNGVEGFRLFQAYVVVAVAALAVAAAHGNGGRATRALLGVGLVVAGYAVARVLAGPADAEVLYALSFESTTQYGGAVRAVGSFSGAVGLSSFLTPLLVFALVAGFLVPRVRRTAWALAALALVGVLASYGRAPLLAIAVGLAFALAIVFTARDVTRRRKLMAAGFVLGVLGLTTAGVLLATRSSPVLRERAAIVIDPGGDESLQIRLDTWSEALERIGREPFGQGVGTVGSVTAQGRLLTTDNSFLKVLVEQGVVVGGMFLVGLFAAVALLVRRLRRATAEPRGIGVAALAGFVAFLALAATGEYVEQPGKVVAWALLGLAVAEAWRGSRRLPGDTA